MLAAFGQRLASLFRALLPDPLVIAILLTLVTIVLALAVGFPATEAAPRPDLSQRAVLLLDSLRSPSGLWKLLAFAMQMCLILVTGHALAESKPVRALVGAMARTPRSTAAGAALTALVSCGLGLINWGLGLIAGALMAREVGRALHRAGKLSDYPLIAAAGFTALMVFHGGLSGSAPLSMTSVEQMKKVFSPAVLSDLCRKADPALAEQAPGDAAPLAGAALDEAIALHLVMPLHRTVGSTTNVLVCGGLLVVVPAVFFLMARRGASPSPPPPAIISAPIEPDPFPHPGGAEEAVVGIPDRLERSRLIAWSLAAVLLAALARHLHVKGAGVITPDELNAGMLALGLVLHGSVRSYLAAAADGAAGCLGIILQFPIYAGIMAMMVDSGLVGMISRAVIDLLPSGMLPVSMFLAAGVINMFIPSGGAQWGVQGAIALDAAISTGGDPAKMVLAVAYGDQITNMLQPFWALPLLAITGVRARDIIGYTACAMVVAGIIPTVALLL